MKILWILSPDEIVKKSLHNLLNEKNYRLKRVVHFIENKVFYCLVDEIVILEESEYSSYISFQQEF